MTVSAAEQEKTGLGNYFIGNSTKCPFFPNLLQISTCGFTRVASVA
jgi:hypothetical protein